MEIKDFLNFFWLGAVTLAALWFVYYYRLRYEVEGIRVYTKEKKREWINIILLLGTAFLIKLIMSSFYEGHETDMNCFYAWSDMIFDNGIGEFYYLDAFTDYPPGYMAILWVIAAIRRIFSISTMGTIGRILIKLVPMLADVGTGFLIYVLAKRKFSEGSSLLLSFIYVLNPVVVADSVIWGQTDSVFTIFVLLTCYFCMEEKRIPAYFTFVIGVLIKPQTLIFAPILIWTIIEQVFLKDFDVKKMLRDLAGGLGAIAVMVLLALPFGIEKVASQYVDTLGSYEYCTINAYNFWALIGKNWAEQSDKFLFLECRQWGMLAIVAAVALSGLIFFRLKEDKSKYFISMSVVVSTMFLFSVRMHERYMFPVVALTLCAFLLKPTKELFFTYAGFYVVQYINIRHVLYYFEKYDSTGPVGGGIGITALLTLAVFGYLFFAAFSKSKIEEMREENSGKRRKRNPLPYIVRRVPEKAKAVVEKKKFSIQPSRTMKKFTRLDWIVLGAIMVVYSAIALYDLGDMAAPETSWESQGNGSAITLDLGQEQPVDMLYAFLGNYENRRFALDVSQDGQNYESVGQVIIYDVFSWNKVQVEDSETPDTYNLAKEYRYIRLTSQDNEAVVNELVITDKEGKVLTPVNTGDYPELFDEQELYDPEETFRSGTYFDEIYHARTAYEMIQGIYNYENTHPPLGKFFISLGIRVFGMNPFGWRIAGVLFGIGMLPFMYLFGRRLFGGQTWAAGALTFLFAFDFMHFTQTRISTIDVYGTFFILAMFYFMLKYSQTSFYDTPLWKTFIPLGLSAIMMGLGCASKWTAVYASAGLAIFLFAILFVRYREYVLAKKDPKGETAGIRHEHIVKVFPSRLVWTLAFCVLFFVVIAGLIYLLSYIPFVDGQNSGLFDRMLMNQETMFSYHSKLEATHPYQAAWYEWPIMARPMYYYSQTVADGLREGISAFGNPLVWWAGIPAFIYMLYLIFKEKDRTALFLVFSYLVQYVPWMLVPRCTFTYHYFPCVPFLAMMVVYIMVRLVKRDKKWMKWVFVYLAAAFVLFILFYPVLSGQPIAYNFARDGLKWLPDWVLV
ncbi:MAG: glycosyltransferase family 39 protein [Lachnospiraceae bacterium]|nr:glycosyltransferase family 39 protein [Lachnospiraceae bacterium]